MAASIATLSACGVSQAHPELAPDPIVEQATIDRTVCPPEVTADAPAAVPAYDGPAIDVAAPYLVWLALHLSREAALDLRLADGKAQCP